MNSAFWWSDWSLENGRVAVKSTGHHLPLGGSLVFVCLRWLLFFACIQIWRLRTIGKPGIRVAFYPNSPRPWYFVWACLRLRGARFTKAAEEADLVCFFEDQTTASWQKKIEAQATLNQECRDVSKSRVGDIFERVFGYSIAVDPISHAGDLVEKSEKNGAHDGRVVAGPCKRRFGFAYQRLVDNRFAGDLVRDYRCLVVGPQIPVVFVKERKLETRFSNQNSSVTTAAPETLFSASETERLVVFAREIGLEWGAIDVLRDRKNGRLYIVDVNKTNIDPPSALGLFEKLGVTSRVADALDQFLVLKLQG
ncbi:hypothetical protein [Hyphobacterium sp.]|uniref:hypothetical protein n=1 Tax=Hyphobacterium sp. TaxID=2004662 RepID=UPI003BAD35B5